MTEPLILAIDHGTQSVRALVFDLRGHLVATSQVALDGYAAPRPGWVEHDADAFWQAVATACRGLWDLGTVRPSDLRGVVLTTQRGTVINLDADGRPLRPAIVWADRRRAEPGTRLAWWWDAAFRALRLRGTIRGFEQEAEANWIAQRQPELWARTARFVLLSGWLHYKLTGRHADSVGNQVGYIPFDYRRGRWAPRWDWKWQVLDVAPSMLPDLVPCGSTLGTVGADAAAATGLPAGLPVIAGASDKACEVLGAGCLTPESACLSYGTTATINTTTTRYVETLPFVPPYPAALPGRYSTEVMVSRGYWLVTWFAEQFGQPERQRAEAAGMPVEAFFDDLLAATPPGAHGLVLQPTWNPGVKWPGPEARGAVIGFTDAHGRAHLYRAIVEGIAFGLREGRERIERRSGTPITRLRVAGGGSQSDGAMQVTADVFGLPAERPHLHEASGLGAAIVGAVGLKLHRDVDTAVAAMTRPGRRFDPDPANVALYDRLYRQVVVPMYRRLQPLYESLQALADAAPAADRDVSRDRGRPAA